MRAKTVLASYKAFLREAQEGEASSEGGESCLFSISRLELASTAVLRVVTVVLNALILINPLLRILDRSNDCGSHCANSHRVRVGS